MKTSSTDEWFTASVGKRPAKLRLFCFPYAGGRAAIFRSRHKLLPDTVELCAFQLPGHGNRMRESPSANASDLASEISAVFPRYLDKPFAIFGHSVGALIGFELARHLRSDHGVEPAHLFASGRGAPQVPETEDFTHKLPDDEFIEELRRLNGTPEDALQHPELMKMIIPVLRAGFEMSQTYEYKEQPPLSCPITVFGGIKDTDVTRESLSAWQEQTSSGFTLRMLPGTHFFLHEYERELLQMISQDLHALAL